MVTLINIGVFLGVILILAQRTVPGRAEGPDRPTTHGSDAGSSQRNCRATAPSSFTRTLRTSCGRTSSSGLWAQLFFDHPYSGPVPVRGPAPHGGPAPPVLERADAPGEGIQYNTQEERPARRRQARVVCPPPAPKATKPCPEEKPPEIVIPPAAQDNKGVESHQDEAKPPGEQAPKSAPAPSFWEKLQRKVKFWQ